MSLTLGEKLRQAREERGVSISEVAEQTRISPLYIESIENDDYRNLPGGIFNKGFIKSFAKYVGVNEQEALADYGRLIAAKEGENADEVRTYRPEVLTDDRSHTSSAPTVIVAVIILALMTAGVLFLLNYLRRPPADPAPAVAVNAVSNSAPLPSPSASPEQQAELGTIEFRSANKMTLLATVDNGEVQKTDIAAGAVSNLKAKDTITLNYLRWNAPAVQLTFNGKSIKLPSAPLSPADKDRIIFTISRENAAQILANGSIQAPESTPTVGVPSTPAPQTPAQQRPTPLPPKPASTPTPSPAKAKPLPSPSNRPPAAKPTRTMPRT